MTNRERIEKLEAAEKLIRDVEFSYPVDHLVRRTFYKFIVMHFSHIGFIGRYIYDLKKEINREV